MKLWIMQPYVFPYIWYFQLIHAVDTFVFYDDVNFIKNGWINRNRILVNWDAHYLTIQLNWASSFKLINEVNFIDNRQKLLKTIAQSYKKAPFFDSIMPILNECFSHSTDKISEQAIFSITTICKYLDIKTSFEVSSEVYSQSKGLDRMDRIISICNLNNSKIYINPIGWVDLYNKESFRNKDIDLFFIKTNDIVYQQFENDFISNLSIIDVLMFIWIEWTRNLMNQYVLI